MRTSLRTDASFSETDDHKRLNLVFPKSWDELTQPQLYYVYLLISLGTPTEELPVWAMIRFAGLNVTSRAKNGWNFSKKVGFRKYEYFFLESETIAVMSRSLRFLSSYPDHPVVVKEFGGFRAVDPLLHGVRFSDYLELENYWQGYLYSKDEQPLIEMARILYRDFDGNRPRTPNNVQCMASGIWFASFKAFCVDHWPNLFSKSVGNDGSSEAVDMEDVMNAEIRGLTGGDITKEADVLAMDVWRALTELDAKAKEASQQKAELAKMKKK